MHTFSYLQLRQSAIAYRTILVLLRHMIRVPFVLDIINPYRLLISKHTQVHTYIHFDDFCFLVVVVVQSKTTSFVGVSGVMIR